MKRNGDRVYIACWKILVQRGSDEGCKTAAKGRGS